MAACRIWFKLGASTVTCKPSPVFSTVRFCYPLLLGAAVLLGIGCGGAADRSAREMQVLEDTLRALLAAHPGATVAVSVRDPASGARLDINGDTLFHAASTMKVPVMVEVFRQAAAGAFSLDDSMRVQNLFRSIVDTSHFSIEDDSDDALYTLLGRRVPIRTLVYEMITVSSNLATNLLIERVTADSVQQTLTRMGGRHMRVLRGVEDLKAYRAGLSNSATSADLAAVLEAIARGEAVSSAASAEMVEILLAQRFNEMIPARLPEGTRVAHKTGWITGINHDAAIVYPAEGEPYVLVLLTRGFETTEAAAALGAEIAALVHQALR